MLTTWRSWSFICKGGWYGLFLLLEITIVSVLFGLNFTSHFSDQRCNWLEKNYISFIRPLMEYADVIWDNQKQNLINKLEYIQWELTTWRSWSFICKGGWYGLFLLLEITIASVLFGLNFTSHFSDQRCNWVTGKGRGSSRFHTWPSFIYNFYKWYRKRDQCWN
jgi:uncharacterized membrane protein